MDWTGTTMQVSGRVGRLILSTSVAGPYERSEGGVVEFVTTYAIRALEQRKLERILVYDSAGRCLGEVLPPVKKAPF